MRDSARNVLLAAAGLLICVAPLVTFTSNAMQDEKLRLDKPAPVVRKRVVKKKRVVEQVPLLRIEWVVMKRDENELPKETSTDAIFHDGDRLQLRIRANQKSYLHILQHTDGEADGNQVFPDSSIRNGTNLVNKYEDVVIPSDCEPKLRDDNGNCWFRVNDPPGREIFTVILSREAVPDTLREINMIGGKIKMRDLARIKETPATMTSRQILGPERAGGNGSHAITVINKVRNDNEELIVKISLNHKERSS